MNQVALQALALLRIEKKLDELLRLTKEAGSKQNATPILQQLDFKNQTCPLCNRGVKYIHDGDVVNRICGCVPQKQEE